MKRPLLAVIGNARLVETDPRYEAAREVGRLAIGAGFRVMTGGLGGVMEAASRGAHEAEGYRSGDTIGILPGTDADAANPWVDVAIPSGLDHFRNGIVANAHVVIAVGGGAGTLSEMALGWVLKRPVIGLVVGEGWAGRLAGEALDHRHVELGEGYGEVVRAESAEEAVAVARSVWERGGRERIA